jgi:hypothetical protein
MYVPTGGRAAPFGLAYPVAVGAVLFLATAVEQSLIYSASTPFVEDMLFEAALLLAVCLLCAAGGLWLWRGLSARGTASWTDYRAVLIGLGGGFGLFFLLTFISTAVHVPLPWPPEWGGLALLLVPGSLAWVLVRRQVFRLRQALYRPAVSAALIAALLLMALLLSPTLQSAGLGVALVLLAALGVPAAQRELELQRGRARE